MNSTAARTAQVPAFRMAPGALETILKQALQAHHEGRLDGARGIYERILADDPRHFEANHMLGVLLAQRGERDTGAELIRRAISINPQSAPALGNLGNLLREQGKLEQAEKTYRQSLAISHDNADAQNGLGCVLRALGRLVEAVAAFGRALTLHPDHAGAAQNLADLGRMLMQRREFVEAEIAFRRMIARFPDRADLLHDLGVALSEQHRFAEAVDAMRRALKLDPGLGMAYVNICIYLARLGKFEEAIEAAQCAIAIDPDNALAHNNLGAVCADAGLRDKVDEPLERACALDPELTSAHLTLGLHRLLLGDFAAGLKLYEWRRKLPDTHSLRSYAQPQWLGDTNISGKHLFVYCEQGFGDTIQFIRYLPKVRELGARVTFAAYDRLLPLLRIGMADTLAGIAIIGENDPPPPFDCHVPLLSLPLAFGTRLETIPAPPSYLVAEPGRIARWEERIGRHGFRIGICWNGNIDPIGPKGRNFPLSELSTIAAMPGVQLISLQKGPGEEQLQSLPEGMVVETLQPDFDTPDAPFLDTAAVMASCDLVISLDTSVAHLAGALGVPVWVMLSYSADWRWLLDREDSPWYPTMRLFRQDRLKDWRSAFVKAEQALAERLAQG